MTQPHGKSGRHDVTYLRPIKTCLHPINPMASLGLILAQWVAGMLLTSARSAAGTAGPVSRSVLDGYAGHRSARSGTRPSRCASGRRSRRSGPGGGGFRTPRKPRPAKPGKGGTGPSACVPDGKNRHPIGHARRHISRGSDPPYPPMPACRENSRGRLPYLRSALAVEQASDRAVAEDLVDGAGD